MTGELGATALRAVRAAGPHFQLTFSSNTWVM